jgi:hypothetical protein
MSDHTHDECPNCNLVDELIAVLDQEPTGNPILHLNALTTVITSILSVLKPVGMTDNHSANPAETVQ